MGIGGPGGVSGAWEWAVYVRGDYCIYRGRSSGSKGGRRLSVRTKMIDHQGTFVSLDFINCWSISLCFGMWLTYVFVCINIWNTSLSNWNSAKNQGGASLSCIQMVLSPDPPPPPFILPFSAFVFRQVCSPWLWSSNSFMVIVLKPLIYFYLFIIPTKALIKRLILGYQGTHAIGQLNFSFFKLFILLIPTRNLTFRNTQQWLLFSLIFLGHFEFLQRLHLL